ncbi:MAG: hypothetical protein QXQ28_03095 [Candidatus Nezhaarchaeales archaeon]
MLYGNYVQPLTIYEVLNAIWKESYLAKTVTMEEARKLVRIFKKASSIVKVTSLKELI